MLDYDIIVVGGGPSGLMSCVAAGERGASVLLIDKGDKLGRKLGISGGGRCNVTNAKEQDELIANIPGTDAFIQRFSALEQQGYHDLLRGLGIRLKEEDNGRMFPVTDKASSVVNALIGKVKELGTDIRTNSPVNRVLYENGRTSGVELKSGK